MESDVRLDFEGATASDLHLRETKVAHLTSVHVPSDTRIFYKECATLSRAGYRVVLIAPHDGEGVTGGVRTRTVPKPRNRAERMTRTAWRIFRTALNENADVYHFHDPELIGVGLLLRLLGKRVVYDVHEDVPKQILSKHWIRPILRPCIAKATGIIEFATTLLFDGIVAATPAIAKRFPGNRTVTVQNFPVLGKGSIAPGNSYASRPVTIAYVGAMTAVRGIREMVQAIMLLPRRFNASLVLAGTFDPELETEVRDMQKLGCVNFIGWQSQQRVRDLLGNARAGLVLFHPAPNHMEAQPNKLFEYMQAGIPVVASDFPLWREIVNSCNCGLLVDPLDPKAIADAIQWLLEHPTEAEAMGARGMRAINYEYNWNSEGEKLLSLYQVISRGPQPTLQGS